MDSGQSKNIGRYLPFAGIAVSVLLVAYLFRLNSTDKPGLSLELRKHIFYNDSLNRKMSGSRIPDIVYMDSTRLSINLSGLPSQGPVLVFRFSVMHCNSCYGEQLKVLRDQSGKIPVCILASYYSMRDYQLYLRLTDNRLPTYKIEEKGLNNYMEELGSPYYFILHPDMRATDFYVPDASLPEAGMAYLKQASKILHDTPLPD